MHAFKGTGNIDRIDTANDHDPHVRSAVTGGRYQPKVEEYSKALRRLCGSTDVVELEQDWQQASARSVRILLRSVKLS